MRLRGISDPEPRHGPVGLSRDSSRTAFRIRRRVEEENFVPESTQEQARIGPGLPCSYNRYFHESHIITNRRAKSVLEKRLVIVSRQHEKNFDLGAMMAHYKFSQAGYGLFWASRY